MGKAFDWVSGTRYAAMQRAMRAIWFGEPAPLNEAVQATGCDRGVLEVDLARFVNLVVRALPTVPEELHARYSDHARRLIAEMTCDIEALRASNTVLEEQRTVLAALNYERSEVAWKLREARSRLASRRSELKRVEARAQDLQRHIAVLAPAVDALADALCGEVPPLPC